MSTRIHTACAWLYLQVRKAKRMLAELRQELNEAESLTEEECDDFLHSRRMEESFASRCGGDSY